MAFLSIFVSAAKHKAWDRAGSWYTYTCVLITLLTVASRSGLLTQYIKGNRVNEVETSKVRARNTKPRVRAQSAGGEV